MARTVLDIKPDGGGDHTTLAAAWSAIKDLADWGDGYDFRKFPGASSSGDVTIGGATVTPTSSDNLRIYAARGSGSNGTWQATTACATAGAIILREPFTHLGYIAGVGDGFQVDGGSTHPIQVDVNLTGVNGSGMVLDSLLCKCTDPDQQSGLGCRLWQDKATNGNSEFTIRNCIFYITGDAESFSQNNGILTMATILNGPDPPDAITMTLNLHNNLFLSDCVAKAGTGEKVHRALGTSNRTVNGTMVVVATNNYFIGLDFNAAVVEPGTGTYTYTGSDYNAAQDASVTSILGGSNNITDIVAADEFETPASDWRIKAGAQGANAGTPTLGVDMIRRPRNTVHKSIGPLEFIDAIDLYKRRRLLLRVI